MTDLFAPLSFTHGPAMKNRLMLAPLTNLQSHPDGTLSDDEIRWLTLRAQGGFGVVMTAASNVQKVGLGFPGQLGVWSDNHLPGLTQLASALKAGASKRRRMASCAAESWPVLASKRQLCTLTSLSFPKVSKSAFRRAAPSFYYLDHTNTQYVTVPTHSTNLSLSHVVIMLYTVYTVHLLWCP